MSFNIFEVAKITLSEEIHTAIIAELINPKSRYHNNGADFLKLFLEGIKQPIADLADADVEVEKKTADGRRIDMVIQTKEYYIPFEVKIWARDQPRQITDYHAFAKENAKNSQTVPCIYYLTPNGHAPDKDSAGTLRSDEIVCISFREHILSWLDQCIATNPPADVCEIMRQLRDSIARNILDRDVIHALQSLQRELIRCGVAFTECTPDDMIFTLSKRDKLEFALHISRENQKKLAFTIICGLEREDGGRDYTYKTAEYIKKNGNAFSELLNTTFNDPKQIDAKSNVWARWQCFLEWGEGSMDEYVLRAKEQVRQIAATLRESFC